MSKILDKFQELSFNAKIGTVVAVFAAFILLVAGLGLAVKALTPATETQTETEPASTSTSTPRPTSGLSEDYYTGDIATAYSEESAAAAEDIKDFLPAASKEICQNSATETTESKIQRLAPYVLNVEDKVKEGLFDTQDINQICNPLGDLFLSYDKETKVITYSSTFVQNFTPMSQEDVPDEEKIKGKRYTTITIGYQKQADGSWKAITINGK